MRPVRLREPRDHGPQLRFREPFRKQSPQHALAAPADASDHNHDAVVARLRRSKKTPERRSPRFLIVSVQIKRCADVQLSAADAPLCATIFRRRRRFSLWWRGRW